MQNVTVNHEVYLSKTIAEYVALSCILNNTPMPKDNPTAAAKKRAAVKRWTLNIDRTSRVVFPLTFILFNIAYVWYYAKGNKRLGMGGSTTNFVPVQWTNEDMDDD